MSATSLKSESENSGMAKSSTDRELPLSFTAQAPDSNILRHLCRPNKIERDMLSLKQTDKTRLSSTISMTNDAEIRVQRMGIGRRDHGGHLSG